MEEPRKCFIMRLLRGDRRNGYLLVRIDPPLIGQTFGLGGCDIHEVVLATRHLGDALPPNQWPLFVHVARPLVALEGRDVVHEGELEPIAWAELYQTEVAARNKML
jgi:hypothetical protein